MRPVPVRPLRRVGTHRLVPSKHLRHGDSVLTRLADDDRHLAALFDLDAATNERLLAERGRALGIEPEELAASGPYASVINAAFTHPHPLGARFNGPDRGAWYAACELQTAQAEVAFHKGVELAEIGSPAESVTYDEFRADFRADFHDLRSARDFRACLDPKSYVASQALGASLLEAGSPGIVYPSVRQSGGTCLVCFRPSLVKRVRPGARWRFSWDGSGPPTIGLSRTFGPEP